MLKKGRNPEEGIDAFEGFCVDLMREIALLTDMTYSIHLVRDGKYGGQMANGSWNGMIGELIDGVSLKNQTKIVSAWTSTIKETLKIEFL